MNDEFKYAPRVKSMHVFRLRVRLPNYVRVTIICNLNDYLGLRESIRIHHT